MKDDQRQQDNHVAVRDYYRRLLILALSDSDQSDADQIVAAWLDSHDAGGPLRDLFGAWREHADWWAETAPKSEVQEYVRAGMQALGGRALGRTTRLRLMAQLWRGLSSEDKAAFLARAQQ